MTPNQLTPRWWQRLRPKHWPAPIKNLLRPVAHFARRIARPPWRFLTRGLPTWIAALHHCRRLCAIGRRRIPDAATAGDRLIVMLACSYLPVDPRIEREARALAARGYRVKVLCPVWDPPTPPPDWGPRVEFRLLPNDAGHFAHGFPYVHAKALLDAALEEDAWAYHGHDLDTALATLLAAARKGVPAVCDFHEWYSENVSYNARTGTYHPHGWIKRRLYQRVEEAAFRAATEIITVCDSIAEAMETQYRADKKVHVIRNIPPLATAGDRTPRDLHEQFGIPRERRIILYQGGVGPSRNLEPVIRAMAHVDRAVFVIRGPGNDVYGPGYLQLAREVGAEGKVFCAPAVPSREVVREAQAADAGLWTLLADVGLNFRLALPNKVFEYLAAGIPLVVADLPEVRKIVDTYQVGVCFDLVDPRSIAAAINRMADDAFRSRCAANIPRALRDLQADREWAKLVAIYDRLATKSPAPQALAG